MASPSTHSIESESKYSLIKSFAKNFTWKIDGFVYGPDNHKKQFKIDDTFEMQLELCCDTLTGYYRYNPRVSLKGSNASFEKFNLFISDVKGTQLGSIWNVEPNEEFKAVTMLLHTNGYNWLMSNTGPKPTNGSITLQIKIEATLNLEANSLGRQVEGKYWKMLKDFHAVAYSDQLADFTFTVGGKDFPVHKLFLGARSVVFMKMFTGEFKERSAKQVEIKDISKEAFQKFLGFIYSCEVELTADDVIELLDLANKYEVVDLKAVCQVHLMEGLNVSNAHDVFQYAHFYNCSMDLKKAAFELVQKSFTAHNYKLPDEFLNDPEAVKKSISLKNMMDESLKFC